MAKKWRHFTAQEDADLIALRAQGMSYAAIGRKIGRPANSLHNRLKLLTEVRGKPSPAGLPKPSPAGQPRPLRVPGTSGVCKCLGGCGQSFLSPDRFRIRVCSLCKSRDAWKDGNDCFSLSL